MSQIELELAGEPRRLLVFGFDAPMSTFFLQLWDESFDADFEWGAPARVAGYHPIERGLGPAAGEYGPYPLAFEDVSDVLKSWGLSEVREKVMARLTSERPPP